VTLGDPGAGIMLPDRPFDERERALVRREMEAFYETFLDVVASRKGRSRDEVEPLAGGRVWHARAARDVDLVDGVGSRRDLVESLARRLRCRPERIVLRHVGGSGPLEDVGGLSLVESGLLEAADSLRLVGSERMAAELPLYPAG